MVFNSAQYHIESREKFNKPKPKILKNIALKAKISILSKNIWCMKYNIELSHICYCQIKIRYSLLLILY